VLAGRKTSGTISGLISVNGSPKEEHSFRRVMAYVEQFDSLRPTDTAREAIEFSAALRLPARPHLSGEPRLVGVESILDMLELGPIEGSVVGSSAEGFTFEQRKRLSIAVELAANPSILFLDEPTSVARPRWLSAALSAWPRPAAASCAPSTSPRIGVHLPLVRVPAAAAAGGADGVLWGPGGGLAGPGGLGAVAHRGRDRLWGGRRRVCLGSGFPRLLPQVRALFSEHRQGGRPVLPRLRPLLWLWLWLPPGGPLSPFLPDAGRPAAAARLHVLLEEPAVYNFVRMVISLVIALLFASAFARFEYSTDVDTISLAAVMYITSLFIG
jgi:hypothetical protein